MPVSFAYGIGYFEREYYYVFASGCFYVTKNSAAPAPSDWKGRLKWVEIVDVSIADNVVTYLSFPGFGESGKSLRFPTGIPLILIIVIMGWRIRRSAVPRVGECELCSYTLVGNVSGICPECGTTIPEEQRTRLSLATEPADA